MRAIEEVFPHHFPDDHGFDDGDDDVHDDDDGGR